MPAEDKAKKKLRAPPLVLKLDNNAGKDQNLWANDNPRLTRSAAPVGLVSANREVSVRKTL